MNQFPSKALWGTNELRIGFGTNRLGALSAKERDQLLGRVWDLGVRHFDTAPLYSSGDAEKWLGDFLSTGRIGGTVMTKFGIAPAGISKSSHLRNIARFVRRSGGPFSKLPEKITAGLRGRKPRSEVVSQNSTRVFSPALLINSVEESLAKLKRDHLEVLALHEPDLTILEQHEFLTALHKLKDQGKIGAIAAGGYFPEIFPLAKKAKGLFTIYQFDSDQELKNLTQWKEAGLPPPIVFGAIASSSTLDAVGVPLDAPRKVSQMLLANPGGMVIFSTTKTAHAEQVLQFPYEKK